MARVRWAIAVLLLAGASCATSRPARDTGAAPTSSPSPPPDAASAAPLEAGLIRPVTHQVPARLPVLGAEDEPKKPWDEDAEDDFPTLTLDEAIHTALAYNPTLAQAGAAARRVQGQGAQVGFRPNPTFGYVASNIGDDGTIGEHGAFVSQTLVTAGKLKLNRAVAAGDLAAAEAIWRSQELRVTADVTALFYAALAAQRQVEAARRLEEVADKGLEITKRRFEGGETTRGDLLQAEVVLDRATISTGRAGIAANAAWRRLAAAIGQPDLPPLRLAGDLGPSDDAEDLDEIDLEAIWLHVQSMSPELQTAAARIARTRARISREHAEATPNVDVQGQLQHDFANDQALGGLQIGVALPLWHKNQGAIAAAYAEHDRAVADYARLELALRDRLAEAVGRAEEAGRRIETYRDEIVPKAKESLELIQSQYDEGETDLLRLLTAQESYAAALVDLIQYQADWRRAWAAIDGLLLSGALEAPPDPPSPGNGPGLTGVPRAE